MKRILPSPSMPKGRPRRSVVLIAVVLLLSWCVLAHSPVIAQDQPKTDSDPTQSAVIKAATQSELDSAFVKMLSGAVLDGSFTKTGPDDDPTQLSQEKYTIGEVKKLAGKMWLIPARIQYGEHDVTLPVMVPIEWAGDTPVIVVDNLGLPGFGTVSARVMFFEDHYAGYWKHGKRGGHLFGVIRRDDEAANVEPGSQEKAGASGSNEPATQKEEE